MSLQANVTHNKENHQLIKTDLELTLINYQRSLTVISMTAFCMFKKLNGDTEDIKRTLTPPQAATMT